VNGWVCEPDDGAGLAALMQKVDPERMGPAARATAERFGIDAMAKRLTELYGSLTP
jgi:hypothetical protein